MVVLLPARKYNGFVSWRQRDIKNQLIQSEISMNNLDAAKILNLSGELNPTTIKAAYRKACSLYHPDRNPHGKEMMQAVNSAYEVLKDFSGKLDNEGDDSNYCEALSGALSSIFGLAGLDIEVCGSWVWVSGETKSHKSALKEAGFKWAPKKKRWYFRPEGERTSSRGKYSMDDIRERHGSQKARNTRKNLAA